MELSELFGQVGKGLYDRGMYKASTVFLQAYVDTPNSLMPGRHLLGYAHANLNNARKASEQLRPCVDGMACSRE